MRGATLPLPQYVILTWCLVKYRDSSTFIFTLILLLHHCYSSPSLFDVSTLSYFERFIAYSYVMNRVNLFYTPVSRNDHKKYFYVSL